MAGLTTASLLAKDGFDITVLEQNWLPGGCASSYPRKHFWFESGATTVIGLDPGMPVRYLLDQIDADVEVWPLDIPMKVYLKNGEVLTRYQNLGQWIEEAERVFGKKGQREFWQYCYDISQFVWDTSLKQLAFPPSSFQDIIHTIKNFQPNQVYFARLAYQTVGDLLRKYGLDKNE
ncbi:MAG: NAD(P)-binding protein, partial [Bacteroidetes bacterium]|nr:NAD(P)-binding protein [Bacteroidota bacterium]